jgi:hypothetical protein
LVQRFILIAVFTQQTRKELLVLLSAQWEKLEARALLGLRVAQELLVPLEPLEALVAQAELEPLEVLVAQAEQGRLVRLGLEALLDQQVLLVAQAELDQLDQQVLLEGQAALVRRPYQITLIIIF